ncbi:MULTISPECIES: hypothetical protein [Eisenbergiella]|nr:MULTISPECIES: hypothetical protein [Eisenbergiella]
MDSCLRIDVSTHSVKVNQREIFLSRKEFDLLYFLYVKTVIGYGDKINLE